MKSSASAPALRRRRGHPVRVLLFSLGALSAGACGHGSDTKAGDCVPGQSIACAGVNACAGYQVCKSDGSGYGDCQCGDSGIRAFPQRGPYSGLLGATCVSPNDCRNGLECVTKDSSSIHDEGPSSGMCLTKCLVAHDFCKQVDATSKCVVLDDKGTTDPSDDAAYCLPGCKLGAQPASADKCRGRTDLVCGEDVAGSGVGYCRPACRSDVDCAPRFCDLGTGLCTDTAPSGAPIGAACDPNGSTPVCAGGCIPEGQGTYAECSGVCSYGTQGCGENKDLPLDVYCSISAATQSGPGDLGFCTRTCDCDTDCARADAVCEPHSDLTSKTGRKGLCASKTLPSGSARQHVACP